MKKRRGYRLIKIILLLTAVVCLIPVGQACYLSVQHKEQQKELKTSLEKVKAQEQGAAEQRLDKFQELYSQNSDLTGWLAIKGTVIDYPVLQCEDDSYYLSHSFYKEKDKYGCLFVKNQADVHTPGTNFIIYGHNMKDGSMFGTLESYKSKEFYKGHSEISFDTLYEERDYQILAVFETELYGKDEFPYYQFYQAETENEFQDFYRKIKELSFYDTGVAAEYGDTFLTLSTCSDSGGNNRFVVVAKRLTEEKYIY